MYGKRESEGSDNDRGKNEWRKILKLGRLRDGVNSIYSHAHTYTHFFHEQ